MLSRNDKLFITALVATLTAVVLVAFAPMAAAQTSFVARLWSVAESAFFLAVVSTFIAAFAGTWGAQLLAERNLRRKELLREIQGTNAAIGLAFSIANAYITTKKQHIRDLVAHYSQQCSDRELHAANIANGRLPPGTPFPVGMELKTISPPFSPIDELRKFLGDRISPDGKALVLLTPLVQSIRGLEETFEQRNVWIQDVKQMPFDSDTMKLRLYFGLPFAPGKTDERYPNFMKAMGPQTDDCIGFSVLLAQSLKAYGERLASRYGGGAPTIAAPNFDMAGDLMPDMTAYVGWTRN